MDTRGISETFAGYGIERILGRGGMGTVYLARHPRLPRQVALKILNADLLGDNEIRQRFEREADLVARLDHPNIVAVQDRGIEGPNLWIAMQYVPGCDGGTLGSVDPARAIRIIIEIAAALDFAHGRGILHRDVKPANILLSSPDPHLPERVLLADFGIARLRDDVSGVTQTGTFTATLAYASPEQLSGRILDHRSDQYSLACTLFTFLTGTPPFTATNPAAVIGAHLAAPAPRVSERRPGSAPELDLVIQRALAKDPNHRFASCTEFALAAARAVGNHAAAPAGFAAPAGRPPLPANARPIAAPPHNFPPPAIPARVPPRHPGPMGRSPLLLTLWCAFFALALSTRGLAYWLRWYPEVMVGPALALAVLVPLVSAARWGHLLGSRTALAVGLTICAIGSPLALALGQGSFPRAAVSAAVVISAAATMGSALAVIFSTRAPKPLDAGVAAVLAAVPVTLVGAIELIYLTMDQGWWSLWPNLYLLQLTIPPLALLALILLIAQPPALRTGPQQAPVTWTLAGGSAALTAAVPIMYTQNEPSLLMWSALSVAVVFVALAIRLTTRRNAD
ncbi:serine/threonine-protein kinase [Nocardia sp. No.11]|uniref:serine/threonine-protein kinase n=1 Tax=Nocardia sp. No.11 TaxID=3128861 RepID=UPI00319DA1BF